MLLEMITFFQVFPFFESATVVRLEHIKYILDQLQDNAVSLTLDADEQELEFLDKSVPYLDKFNWTEDDDNTDTDFTEQITKFSENQQFSESIREQNDSYFTDYAKYIADKTAYSSNEFLVAGHQQEILEFTSSGTGGTWTFDRNTFEYTVSSGSTIARYMISNNIVTAATESYTCDIDMTSTQTSGITLYLADRDDITTAISNVYTWVSGSINSFLLTVIGGGTGDINDACLVMKFTYNTITLSGWMTFKHTYSTVLKMRIAWEAGAISTDPKLNAPFSQANIIKNWWSIYRPTNAGTQNGVAKTFTNSQFIIKRQCKGRYWPDDINMQYGINDGSHIAKIGRYTRDLDTDFVEFELLYQEHE
jgi:hypothetical protein